MDLPAKFLSCSSLVQMFRVEMGERNWEQRDFRDRFFDHCHDNGLVRPDRATIHTWLTGKRVPMQDRRVAAYSMLGWTPAIRSYAETLIAAQMAARRAVA